MTPQQRRLTPEAGLMWLTSHVLGMLDKTGRHRIAIGLAGGPGSGKSTLAGALVSRLNGIYPGIAGLVPMDGFHIKHARLKAMGQVEYKGAPHTFEGAAFVAFLQHLKFATIPVCGPGYSRKLEDTVENAFTIMPETRILVVEGNYLLLPQEPWAGVKPLLDYTVFVDVPRMLIRARLLKRHGAEGLFTVERNIAHIERSDLPNYDLVCRFRERADAILELDVEA